MIRLPEYAGRTMGVLGLGRTGLAAARALHKSGAHVMAWDDNAAQREILIQEGIGVADLGKADLTDMHALVLSPGIAHTHPEPHAIVARCRAAGIPVIGDMEVYARAMNALPGGRPFIIGITGTNGKSTTTALITHILKSAARDAHAGGNIGRAVLDLPQPRCSTIHVLELSSYQLELCPSLHLDVAILLNLSPDHLARHGGMEGYRKAKQCIFANQTASDLRIVGVDDPGGLDMRARLRTEAVPILPVSGSMGLSHGVFAAGSCLVASEAGRVHTVADLSRAMALRGSHNAQNAAAAYGACQHAGLSDGRIAAGIMDFPGLAHRAENLGKIGKVTFVNDSKATNADAAVRALSSWRDIYWIAGGRPKEDGLGATMPYLDRVKAAYLIGEAASQFERELKGHCQTNRCGTLQNAFAAALADAQSGDALQPVILLSPACASFDQFPDFEVRGEAFRALFAAASSDAADDSTADQQQNGGHMP